MNAFGATLKIYREKYGISQAKLAKRAELDHSYVSRLESNQRMPTRQVVAKLCEVLALSEFDTWNLHASAGFMNDHAEPPPANGEIENFIMLVRGALYDDRTPAADKHAVMRSVKLMLDGITFKEIC